jgi:hypothetical protein
MGFVPVQALCGVEVCFLLESIVSIWFISGQNASKAQCMTAGFIVHKTNLG